MSLPELLTLSTEEEYKNYFVEEYCNKSPIATFDGLPVMFYPEMFEHSFYKRANASWKAPKDQMDISRCERMPWIKAVLNDSTIIPRQGYDKARNKYDNDNRVTFLAPNNYIVVIRKVGNKWRFVTAYIVDNAAAASKIQASPAWHS